MSKMERCDRENSFVLSSKDYSYRHLDYMTFPATENTANSIFIAICSCQRHVGKRRAARETWFPRGLDRFDARFFTGCGGVVEEEDTVVLDVGDDYDHLPAKVMAFFRHALEHFEFDWLFKCDDDTYVDLSRLQDLALDGVDLVGNRFLWERGAPSGGAGYLLSRRIVERLVREGMVPATGDEDLLIGREAMRLGAVVMATNRLRHNAYSYPRQDNDLVTAHWLGPERMRAVHTLRHGTPVAEIEVEHPMWNDKLLIHGNGVFARKQGMCSGLLTGEPGNAILQWFDWEPERLVSPPPPKGFEGSAEEFWLPGTYRVLALRRARDRTGAAEVDLEEVSFQGPRLEPNGCTETTKENGH